MWECMDLEVRSYIVSTGVIIVQYHLVHIRDNLVKVAASGDGDTGERMSIYYVGIYESGGMY